MVFYCTGLESELSAAKQNAEQYQLAAQANEEALSDLNKVYDDSVLVLVELLNCCVCTVSVCLHLSEHCCTCIVVYVCTSL